MITWTDGAMSRVSVDVHALSSGDILAFSGGPVLSNICTYTAFGPVTRPSSWPHPSSTACLSLPASA